MGWLRRTLTDPDIRRHLLRDEGETIVREVRKHWVVYVPALGWCVVGLLFLWLTALSGADVAWLPLVLALGFLGWGGLKAASANMDRFVVTNMRVFRVKGVFARSLATMPLGRILDITVVKPLHGRVLGFGHFVFESAAQAQGLREITYVGHPDRLDLEIQRVVQRQGLRGPKVN